MQPSSSSTASDPLPGQSPSQFNQTVEWDPHTLKEWRNQLEEEALALGFTKLTISSPDLQHASERLKEWIAKGYHGEMKWFERSLDHRANPHHLVPGTLRVMSLTLPYPKENGMPAEAVLSQPEYAYISRYALGRDYHKVLRQRLSKLSRRLAEIAGVPSGRVFCDSAPVMEVEIAQQSGLGWRGKHTLLLNREAGSWFFLGELFTSIPFPVDPPTSEHCGRCTACIDVCPTGAIVAPYQVDARRCISYLTIEHPGSIPEGLRSKMGNRIYGCDDCQLCCPWNRPQPSASGVPDFAVRENLDASSLVSLFAWTEKEFQDRLEGSPIRRIGYERWLRNIAIALGNGPKSKSVLSALYDKRNHPSAIVREHVEWAIQQLEPQ